MGLLGGHSTSRLEIANLILRKFAQGFMRDDLFIRVLLTLSSALPVAVAVVLVYGVLLMPYPLWGHVVAGCFVLLMSAWALLLVAGAFSSPQTRTWKWAKKWLPDASGGEGLVLVAVLYAPAVALTLLLRAFGVRGHGV